MTNAHYTSWVGTTPLLERLEVIRYNQVPKYFEGLIRDKKDRTWVLMQENKAHQELWTKATSLREYGALTALFLEGKVGYRPTRTTYLAPNQESLALLPYINPLNRSGHFASTFSQPASTPYNNPYNAMYADQRADLSGYVSFEMKQKLAEMAGKIGVKVLISRPGSPTRVSTIPVTRSGGEEFTFTGHVESHEDIERNFDGYRSNTGDSIGLRKEMIDVLKSCYQISIYDPDYGNNDRLWPMLLEVADDYKVT